MQGTFWALVPPIFAIVMALITKRVYISLIAGILSGALFLSNFSLFGESGAISILVTSMATNVGQPSNFSLIIFLCLLGMLVSLMGMSGGTQAYGNWASTKIKTGRGSLLATVALSPLFFVDDYFNCLTVGNIMRPVTDKFKVPRAKLSYILDATAAPLCIMAPISTWGAAVASNVPESVDGFSLLVQSIPYNIYALMTLFMVLFMVVFNFDFGPMKKHEQESVAPEETSSVKSKGRVTDLVLPIVVLIITCLFFMLYTGGIFEGKTIGEAFSSCPSVALALTYGVLCTLVFTFILYFPRKLVNMNGFSTCFIEGIKTMLPPALILICAWTLKSICEQLELGVFVSSLVSANMHGFLPAICFAVSLGISFATGTSWGTFGILIPIVCALFNGEVSMPMVMTIGAVLGGSICGDQTSPISDTTILSSTGASCDHILHITTQLPYVLIVAACSFLGYLVGGLTMNLFVTLATGFVSLTAILVFFYLRFKKNEKAAQATQPTE